MRPEGEEPRAHKLPRGPALQWALVAGALALYAIVLFHPLVLHLFRGGPAAWIEGDVAEEYWPDLVVLCRGLSHGHLPRWNPFEHGGAPFSADPQAGAYYPINWAICALAGPSPSFHWADARVVLHFWLASLFMAAFLRGEGLGWPASLAGALLFPETPFLRHNWELNLTSGFAWLPLLLLLTRAASRRPTALRGAALGVATAMATLAGSPPAVFYALLVAVPFGIHAGWSAWRSGVPWKSLGAAAAVAVVVAAALVLPMVAPARELAALSVRARPGFEMIAEGSLQPRALMGMVLPALNEHTYVGLLALALCPWALGRDAPYWGAWLFAGIGFAGLWLMLGSHSPLFHVAFAVVPGAAMFRDPSRYSALWGTAALVLTAAGLDAVLKRPAGDRAVWRWGRYTSLVALGVILVGEVPELDPSTGGEGLVFAGIVLALGMVAVAFGRSGRFAGWAVALLLAVDLWPYLPPSRHTRAGPFPFPQGEATLAALRDVAGDDLEKYRTYDEFAIHMRSGSRHALRDFRGYQDPLSLGRYQKVMGELERTPLLLATFNVRWVLWAPHYLHGDGHHFLADPREASWATPRAPHVYEIPAALPMAYWMDGVEVVADADAALERVAARAPAPVVVLEAGSGQRAAAGTGGTVAGRVQRGTEAITVEVEAPTAGLVVVNESWYPGWEARVDGERAEVVRANALVMAVRVGAGAHRIEMTFRPRGVGVFEGIAGLALVGVAGLGVREWRRRRGATAVLG